MAPVSVAAARFSQANHIQWESMTSIPRRPPAPSAPPPPPENGSDV